MHTFTAQDTFTWSDMISAFMAPNTSGIAETMAALEQQSPKAWVFSAPAAAVIASEAHLHVEGHQLRPSVAEVAAILDRAPQAFALTLAKYKQATGVVRGFFAGYQSKDRALLDQTSVLYTSLAAPDRATVYYVMAEMLRTNILQLSRAQNLALVSTLRLAPNPHAPLAHILLGLYAGAIASGDDDAEADAIMRVRAHDEAVIIPEMIYMCCRVIGNTAAPGTILTHPGTSCMCGQYEDDSVFERVIAGWATAHAAGTPGVGEAISRRYNEDAAKDKHLAAHLIVAAAAWLAETIRDRASTFPGR